MNRFRQTRRIGVMVVALLGWAWVSSVPEAQAQRVQSDVDIVWILKSEDPSMPDLDIRTLQKRGFQLFAAADYGAMGFHQTGRFSTKIDNYGPCSSAVRNCQGVTLRRARDNGTSALWFDMDWAYGAPPSEFRKIRRVAPSVANATGGGWTAGSGDMIQGRPRRFGPADGGLGRLAAGLLSTLDKTCRDISGFGNGSHGAGVPLLAGSGCPETWGGGEWLGDPPVDERGWKTQFDALGSTFDWEFWRIPAALKLADTFLGTGWSTYGETTDHYQQIMTSYGSVVPGGLGPPTLQGYPLGLKLRFDSYTFGAPSAAEIQFVQTLIINRSQDVWGVPIDYDSLYFGLTAGFLLATSAGSAYPVPELGVMLYHTRRAVQVAPPGGVIPCTQAFRVPNGVPGCPQAGISSHGYGNGANALVFLKTPLGDLRNKLYTRTMGNIVNGSTVGAVPCAPGRDPFCMPGHPRAADTITFNHHHSGGFGGPDQFTWGSGVRPTFGFVSSTEDNTINGRDLTAQVAGTRFRVFYTATWPTQSGKYNKYAPGQGGQPGAFWDYNHDGKGDTLFMDACTITGCAKFSSDTIAAPPGFPGLHNTVGNVGGYMGFGPFALGGGDTTAFVYALIGNGDSALVWSSIKTANDLYASFYLAPSAPPVPRITATQTRESTGSTQSRPQVQLFWSEDPEQWRDPYLTRIANEMALAPPGTPLAILRTDNPDLQAEIAARAANNLEVIEIYKSCDGGSSWTDDADCVGDPTRDERSRATGLGWAPYARIDVDSSLGNPPNAFVDRNVVAGRNYVYSIVAKSRGATFLVVRRVGAGFVADTLRLAPSLRNGLSALTIYPNVASIYVPVGRQAGHEPAHANFTERDTRVTAPMALSFSDSAIAGSYRMVFGDRLTVMRDSLVSTSAVVRTLIIVEDTIQADLGSGVSASRTVRSDTLIRSSPGVFPVDGTPASTQSAPVGGGDTIRTTAVYRQLGFVLRDVSTPLWLSIFPPTATALTPVSAFSQTDFPGFTLSADQRLAGSFNASGEAHVASPTTLARLRRSPADSVIARDVVNALLPQWNEGSPTTRVGNGGGVYELTWTADPYGTATGFVWNRDDPTALQSEIEASLVARPVGTTGMTNAATAALLGLPQADLVPVRVPFTIRNLTLGRDVSVAMRRRGTAVGTTIRLGTLTDMVSVAVPENEWVPGDRLILLEDVVTDSTTAVGAVLDASNQPIQVTRREVTFERASVACNMPLSCNPLMPGTPGATGYLPISAGDRTRWAYHTGFHANSRFAFDLVGPVTGVAITQVTDSAMRRIRVTPNPFVVFSEYQSPGQPDNRVIFSGLPPRGTLRIYTVAGQFVQQITWEPADLLGDGDLYYDLQSRVDNPIASGLYIWVVTAPSNPNDPASRPVAARGKFVVIRGRPV